LTIVAEGLVFPECPRWRDGALWFSDQHDLRVARLDPASGTVETVMEVPGHPSGLGWLPDGTMLVVEMYERRVLRGDGSVYADLSSVAPAHCNDMIVDARGRAYVGNFGFNFDEGGTPKNTVLALVDTNGAVKVAADDLAFPNGAVITPDGATLIVGESMAARLSAFTIAADGTLTDRRVWAQMVNAAPDGCCLDPDGAIWVASPNGHQVLRIEEGGEVTDRIRIQDNQAYACWLGGDDARTLYVCTAPTHVPAETVRLRGGRIEGFAL
jgi:sugar lactone lactonase YvrE